MAKASRLEVPPPEAVQRYWRGFQVTDGCWEWAKATWSNGYGKIKVRGHAVTTHRVAWAIHNGPVPEGFFVCHKCDNRSCVNPDHLFLGTHADNMADMVRKGRAVSRPWNGKRRGEGNPNAKLTTSDVVAIRLLAKEGVSRKETAQRFGVAASTITGIVNGSRWNIDQPTPTSEADK